MTYTVSSGTLNPTQLNLTHSVPHFFDCGKNESTKALSAILVQPTLLIFWHLGTLVLSPEHQSVQM